MKKKIVIIGGGIIGLCTAYYLNEKGECDQCPTGCATCQNTECYSCLKDFYYLPNFLF